MNQKQKLEKIKKLCESLIVFESYLYVIIDIEPKVINMIKSNYASIIAKKIINITNE